MFKSVFSRIEKRYYGDEHPTGHAFRRVEKENETDQGGDGEIQRRVRGIPQTTSSGSHETRRSESLINVLPIYYEPPSITFFGNCILNHLFTSTDYSGIKSGNLVIFFFIYFTSPLCE